MATENNTQVNSFIKGMNSDVSYLMMQDGQYTFAKNIRITSLAGTNKTENINALGEVRPIEGIKVAYDKNEINGYKINKIYAADTIRNYGVIIFLNDSDDGTWCVARLKNKIGGNKDNDDLFNIIDEEDIKVIFGPTLQKINKDKISIFLRYEDDDNIKLYIADGNNPIMVLNISESQDEYNLSLNGDIEKIQSYPNIQYKPPVFCGLTFGKLKPALVQYSYRLYNKNGIATDISPTTKLIPIVLNKNVDWVVGKDIEGVIKEEDSNCGVKLQFDVSDLDFLDYILIYRITYVENGQLPTIELISDKKIDKKIFLFEDIGQTALQNLTLEEYNSMSGIHIIPNVIESKNDRLFAANIKHLTENVSDSIKNWDARTVSSNGSGKIVLKNYAENEDNEFNTFNDAINFISENKDHDCYNDWLNVNKSYTDLNDIYCFDEAGYYGGTGANISWRFIKTELHADKTISKETSPANFSSNSSRISFGESDQKEIYYDEGDIDTVLYKSYIHKNYSEDAYHFSEEKITKYFKQTTPGSGNYSDPLISYYFKSLRRGELYRYGIVLYDKFGQACPVKWIADIRVPDSYINGFETFKHPGSFASDETRNCFDLNVFPLGIEFKVENLPEEIKAYEIVRCTRTFEDLSTISLGILSKSIQKQFRPNYTIRNIQEEEGGPTVLVDTFDKLGNNYKQYPFTPSGFMTCCNYWTGLFPSLYYQISIYNLLKNYDYKYYYIKYDNKEQKYVIYGKNTDSYVNPGKKIKDATEKLNEIKNIINTGGRLFDDFAAIGGKYDPFEACNWFNKTVFLFASPEFCYTQDLMKTIKNYNFNISLLNFLYPSVNNNEQFTLLGQFNYTMWQGSGSSDDDFVIKNINKYAQHNTRLASFTESDNTAGVYSSLMLPVLLIAIGLYSNYVPNDGVFNIGDDLWKDVQYGYFDKNSEININSTGKYSWKSVRTKSDSYIKLYNNETSWSNLNYRYLTDEEESTFDKNYLGKKINILDLKIPEDRDWDYAFKDKTSDSGETSFIANYENDIISVGGELYCNWVVGGSYGLRANPSDYLIGIDNEKSFKGEKVMSRWAWVNADLKEMFNDDDKDKGGEGGANPWNNNPGGALFAQGGQCAVISVNNNESNSKYITDILGVSNIEESKLGTYLCNLKHDVVPYGGYTYLDRSLNTYYSYGDYVIVKENDDKISYSFSGDCYLMPFEYISAHKSYIKGDYIGGTTQCIAYAIPVETNINLAYTSGYELSRNYKTPSSTNIQKQPSNVLGHLVQDKPAYVYNTAYSAESRTRIFAAQNDVEQANEDDVFDYRCYYSNLKQNDERIDSWTKFQSANYLDADTRYGEITHLRTFHNKLFFWQQKATGLFSVNERTQITDDSGLPLILGTGGVLERYDYIDDTAGMRLNLYCDAMSASTLYWFDDDHQEIKAYADGNGIVQLSKTLGVDNVMNKYADKNNIPNMFYDKKYNEIVAQVLKDKKSIVFNEAGRYFSAIYTIPFDEELTFHNGIYVLTSDKNASIAQWGVVNNTKPHSWELDYTLKTYIEYIVNKSPLIAKVFDNQEIVTHNKPHNYELEYPHTDNNAYFSKHHNYSWTTDLNKTTNTLENEITLREGSYRYAIPRATNLPYGDRIRGKYMICGMEDTNPDYDSSISYVITKFRGSLI